MNLSLIILFCLISSPTVVTSVSQTYLYAVKYIDVPLDHFSYLTNRTFRLRYLINDSKWNGDGPIFFYTGNEGDINLFAQNSGFIWDISPEFNALVVFAEHRYYGQSLPFGNDSFDNLQHLGYLSSSQALADYVYLIDYIQKSNKEKLHVSPRPVIAFGGSYGGMLAAWLRMKYPATVIGAIASSAPIFQFDTLTPCDIFYRILTDVFRTTTSHPCSEMIYNSWAAIKQVTTYGSGRNWLSKAWNLCQPLTDAASVQNLIDWLEQAYANLAMANYPYAAKFLQDLPGHPISMFCHHLAGNLPKIPFVPEQLLGRLGYALEVYTNYTGKSTCVDTSKTFISQIGVKAWDFQACTELIMPMCSRRYDMFIKREWNFTEFAKECYRKFKVLPKREDAAILKYGGKYLKAASNIVFSNGLLDPWAGGGVLKNVSDTVQAILIPDAAHHLDLRDPNYQDPKSVIVARNFHKKSITKWLKQFHSDTNSMYKMIFKSFN